MVDMDITNMLYAKVIDDEDKEDREPYLVPKSRGGGSVVVTICVETLFKKLVGKHASLG